jgi:hypothetical protein
VSFVFVDLVSPVADSFGVLFLTPFFSVFFAGASLSFDFDVTVDGCDAVPFTAVLTTDRLAGDGDDFFTSAGVDLLQIMWATRGSVQTSSRRPLRCVHCCRLSFSVDLLRCSLISIVLWSA